MSPAAAVTTAGMQKQPKCPPTDKWIKMCFMYVCVYDGILFIHVEKEILPFTTTQKGLEDILSEISQTKTNTA